MFSTVITSLAVAGTVAFTPIANAETFTYEENTVAGEGGWVMVQEGIAPSHECVIQLSLQPERSIVVSDSSDLCAAEAVRSTVPVLQHRQVTPPKGGVELGDGSLAGLVDNCPSGEHDPLDGACEPPLGQ